jgi:hypothetical protein
MGQRVPGYNGSVILFKPTMVSDSNVTLSIFTILDHSVGRDSLHHVCRHFREMECESSMNVLLELGLGELT